MQPELVELRLKLLLNIFGMCLPKSQFVDALKFPFQRKDQEVRLILVPQCALEGQYQNNVCIMLYCGHECCI